MSFFQCLESRSREVGGPLCVGIDPRIEGGDGVEERLVDYARRVVEATWPYAAAFKPNVAFFERHGGPGWSALERVVALIGEDIPIILDAKRGDIGSTAEAYAAGLLDRKGTLAVTLSPYLGRESAEPFLSREGRGGFFLCRTSNPGAGKLQELPLRDGIPFYLAVADEVLTWGDQAGLVVAGNDVAALKAVRHRHPDTWFLAPGIGAQGGSADEAILAGARSDGWGLLVAASRSVSDAADPGAAARELRDTIDAARLGKGRRVSMVNQNETTAPKAKTPVRLTSEERRDLLEGLFRVGAFRTGTFTLKSGKESPFYIDLRRIPADPGLLRLAGRAYAELLIEVQADRLAGIPVAALPLATAASLETGMSLIYPRMEPKEHGSGARIEGEWAPGERAVLLDDLITTGGSKREAADILRNAGLIVEDLVVLLERGEEGRRDVESVGIRLRSWAGIEELLEVGRDSGRVAAEKSDEILAYVKG